MVSRKKIGISLVVVALVSTVAIVAFSTPIFASAMTEQTYTTIEVNVTTIEGEARVDGVVVGTSSIEFTTTPAAGGPIYFRDHVVRIFKITEGSITITDGETNTYTMIPETWEGIWRVNGRRFIALGDVFDDDGNEFIVALHGFAVVHFFSDGSTVMRVDGTLRGDGLNYHLVFIVECHLK